MRTLRSDALYAASPGPSRRAISLDDARASANHRAMRALFFASLVLLAACGGSSTDDGSTDGAGSGSSSSGGGDTGPASGTGTLSGGTAFDVKAAYFRWGDNPDGSANTESLWVSFADVPATCAEYTKGLNLIYSPLRVFGLNPRVTGGKIEVGEYDNSADPFADGAHYVGYAAVIVPGGASFPDMQDLHVSLTDVADDAVAGSFTATWSDGTEPLTGTFSVPLCGPSP